MVLAGLALGGMPVLAEETAPKVETFDQKHKTCLENIAKDAPEAFEDALIWQGDGGGRRARHCVAMALFALGHEEEAASRLEKLAKSPDGGSPQMRAGYYVESADLWLEANDPKNAYRVATEGLEIAKSSVDLRIARARASAVLERWDFADIDLTSALAYEPDHARALRYRADTRLHRKKLKLAKADIDKAVALAPEDIDTLLVRGKIREAMRLHALAEKETSKDTPKEKLTEEKTAD